jgi:endonuclease/exonuclease/phosphatase family metal-dependent hydrolase
MRAIFVALFMAASTAAYPADFTVATFNAEFLTRPKVHIKFGLPFDLSDFPADVAAQWNAPGFRDQKFAEAADAVASVVAAINADVIVLNEVGDERDVGELKTAVAAKGVGYDHVAVCACTDANTKQHVAVLSKVPLDAIIKAIPGREGYHTELDDDDSETDTGISKGIIVTFKIAGQSVHLYGVHLASERGGNEQDQQRIAQASIVRRHYLPKLNAGEHIIVAGDLNDGRGQPALRRIRGLDDIWGDLIQTGHHKYFAEADLASRWTYDFQGERNQIDHVLLSTSFTELVTRGGIKPRVPDQTNRLASDHRPFVVRLELR